MFIPPTYSFEVCGGEEKNKQKLATFCQPDYVELFKKSVALPLQKASVYLQDIPYKYKYPLDNNTCVLKRMNGNGQRKLCLEEIQFLTDFGEQIDIVLYTGSAPGNMHGYVSNLFPRIKFILADPNDHNIWLGTNNDLKTKSYSFNKSNRMYDHMNEIVYLYDNGTIKAVSDKYLANIYDFANNKVKILDRYNDADEIKLIMKTNKFSKKYIKQLRDFINSTNYKFYIIQDFFTNDMATFFHEVLKDTRFAFTSDIRSRNEDVIDYEVFWNLAQQYIWVKRLNPLFYKLKFRIPFQGSLKFDTIRDYMKEDLEIYKKVYKIDQVSDYKKGILTYLPGKIYLQAWAPIASTESRLIGTREDLSKPLVTYNEDDYTAQYFYYNSIYRQYVMHDNKYLDKERHICYCGDCALEIHILEEYKNKINPTFEILDAIDIFRNITKFKWVDKHPPHGEFYERTTYDQIYELTKKYRPDCIPFMSKTT